MVENGGPHTPTPWRALVGGEIGGKVFQVAISYPGGVDLGPCVGGGLVWKPIWGESGAVDSVGPIGAP